MLEGQSLKSIYPSKIKNLFTKNCTSEYQQFVKILEENYIRTDTS